MSTVRETLNHHNFDELRSTIEAGDYVPQKGAEGEVTVLPISLTEVARVEVSRDAFGEPTLKPDSPIDVYNKTHL